MKVVAVTGAGISAASGLPMFRTAGGVWTDQNYLKMSHANRYGNYLDQIWPKWMELVDAAAAAEPNAAHLALAEAGWPVVTQNVDGLHTRAGSTDVIEVHGSLRQARCLRCKAVFDPAVHGRECPKGHTKTRLDMVLFGEGIHEGKRAESLVRGADVAVYIGTSGNVEPVAGWHSAAALNSPYASLGLYRPSVLHRARGVLVDPGPRWGDFEVHHQMTANEWVDAGMPLLD